MSLPGTVSVEKSDYGCLFFGGGSVEVGGVSLYNRTLKSPIETCGGVKLVHVQG